MFYLSQGKTGQFKKEPNEGAKITNPPIKIMSVLVSRDGGSPDSGKTVISRFHGSLGRRQSMSPARRMTKDLTNGVGGRQNRMGGAAGRGSIMIGGGGGALFNKERKTEGHTFITQCQAWRLPDQQLMSEYQHSTNRHLYFNDYTTFEYYCPACNLFFTSLNHYHIHIAHREMAKPIDKAIEKALSQIQQNEAELVNEERVNSRAQSIRDQHQGGRMSSMRVRITQHQQRKRETKTENKMKNTFVLDEKRKWFDANANMEAINARRDKLTRLSRQVSSNIC